MNSLLAALVLVMVSVLPQAEKPNLVVNYETLESLVEQSIESKQASPTSVNCVDDELIMAPFSTTTVICSVETIESQHEVKVTLASTDTKVNVKAIIIPNPETVG
jgi:hypothetical protein